MPSPRLDQSLKAATKGYAWLPDLRRAVGRRAFGTRLMGMPAAVVEGPDGVRWFYDEDHVRRAGPRHVRARRARGRRERWLARLVEDVRSGAGTVPAGSAVDVVSYHRDSEGRPLDARVAAVELLNM